MAMSKTEKILACAGHLTRKSIARVVGCSQAYVSQILQRNFVEEPVKHPQRRIPSWLMK